MQEACREVKAQQHPRLLTCHVWTSTSIPNTLRTTTQLGLSVEQEHLLGWRSVRPSKTLSAESLVSVLSESLILTGPQSTNTIHKAWEQLLHTTSLLQLLVHLSMWRPDLVCIGFLHCFGTLHYTFSGNLVSSFRGEWQCYGWSLWICFAGLTIIYVLFSQ